MKRKTHHGMSCHPVTVRLGCATVFCVLALQAFAKDGVEKQDDAPDDEPPTAWADFTMGYASVSGRDASFQSRARQDDDFYGGLSSMRWEKEMGDLTFLIEGHALFGMEDYDITLGLTKKDIGYVKGGFRQFRTWYDSTGGYISGVAGAWVPLYGDDEHSVDRGEIWFEAGLRKEHLPEITFGYSHQWRDGTKDSTIWGQSIPLGPDGLNYGIVPTLNDIDERSDIFRLDITHTLGKTDLGLGLRYEIVNNDDALVIHDQPNAAPADASNDVTTKQHNAYDADLFNAHIFSETHLNDRMLMSFGYSYTSMNTDSTGSSRIGVDRSGVPGGSHAFDAMSGWGQLNMNVANANFWWNPTDNLVIVPSFRAEWSDTSASATFFNGESNRDTSDADTNQLTEQLEVRYTGLENLVLYSKVELSQTNGDITYRNINYDASNRSAHFQSSDITQEKYVIGANWYPMRGLSVSAQYYHQNFNEDFDNSYQFDPLMGTEFSADIKTNNFSTDDLNLRLTWRAMPSLTLVSRYDYQRSTIENRAYTVGPGEGPQVITDLVQSGEITRHIFSQSVTWLPVSQVLVQGTISYVIAETDTPSDDEAPACVTDSDNGYVTANLTIAYALDQKTDIRAGYTYYYSSNFEVPRQTSGIPGSVPYGTDLEEHFFSLSLNRRISRSVIWNMGYGYFTSNDGTTGGHSDFSAHLVSTGLQVRF